MFLIWQPFQLPHKNISQSEFPETALPMIALIIWGKIS